MGTVYSILLVILTLASGPAPEAATQSGGDQCLVKSSSEWGSNCGSCYSSVNSYRINLKNTCDYNLDVKLAVEETTNRWRTFVVNNLVPGDSISGYACDGTGKYVFWTRTAGDKSILFPSDEEIGHEFSQN